MADHPAGLAPASGEAQPVADRPAAGPTLAITEPAGVYEIPALCRELLTSDALTAACKKQMADPSVVESHPPFYWQAEISNNSLDAYYTRMHPSSLQNYANDAIAGVSFQNSHNTRTLPLGRSLDGLYTAGRPPRTDAQFYTIPDLNISGVNTSDFILGMKSGLVKDVSIGFYGGTIRCSVCQRDVWDWECRHYAGLFYDAKGEMAADGEGDMAIGWVHDAHLAEVSAVYDGACPGAEITKARTHAEAGILPRAVCRLLEVRYRIHLPGSAGQWALANTGAAVDAARTPRPGEKPGDPKDRSPADRSEERKPAMPQEIAPGTPDTGSVFGSPALRSLMEAAGLTPAESDEVNLRTLTETVKKLPAIEAERERLAKLADDGRRFRTRTVEDALDAGVAAKGDKFNREQERARLEKADLDLVEGYRDLWLGEAKALLPTGRLTAEGAAQPPAPPPAGPPIPNLAYTG